MKKLIGIVIAIIILLALAVPAMADDNNYVTVAAQFTVGRDDGYRLPLGSEVRHLANGDTEVYRTDGSLLLRAKDFDAKMVPAPGGPAKATHVFGVPSKTHVVNKGNVVEFFQDKQLILKVVDQPLKMSPPVPPAASSYAYPWIEDAYDTGKVVSDSMCDWLVPHMPTSHNPNVISYIFNDIQNPTGTEILQPVLEWNAYLANRWSISTWYVWNSGANRAVSPAVPVVQGNYIMGEIHWYGDSWQMVITCLSGGDTGIDVTTSWNPYTSPGLLVNWALEGYLNGVPAGLGVYDVPDNTTFNDLMLYLNGSPISYTLHKRTDADPGQIHKDPNIDPYLNVTWNGNQTSVTLYTPNKN